MKILAFRSVALCTSYCFLFSTLCHPVPESLQHSSATCLTPQLQLSNTALHKALSIAHEQYLASRERTDVTINDTIEAKKAPKDWGGGVFGAILTTVALALLSCAIYVTTKLYYRFDDDPEYRLEHSQFLLKYAKKAVDHLREKEQQRQADLRQVTPEEREAATELLKIITDIKKFTSADEAAMKKALTPLHNKHALEISTYLSVMQPAGILLTSVSPLHYYVMQNRNPFDLYLHKGPLEKVLKPYANDNSDVRLGKNFEGIFLSEWETSIIIVRLDDSLSLQGPRPAYAVIYHVFEHGKRGERNAGTGVIIGGIAGAFFGMPWIGAGAGGAIGHANKEADIPPREEIKIRIMPEEEILSYTGNSHRGALTIDRLREIANGHYEPTSKEVSDDSLWDSDLSKIFVHEDTLVAVEAPLSQLRNAISQAAPYFRITGQTVIKIMPEMSPIDSAI